MTNEALIEAVRTLEQRAEHLEQEAALIRQELTRIAAQLGAGSPIVARYTIEGETYEVTQAEVEAVQAKMIKPRSEETLRELALVYKVAERQKEWPDEKQEQEFFAAIEASREAAIADGTAIDDEREAAIDD